MKSLDALIGEWETEATGQDLPARLPHQIPPQLPWSLWCLIAGRRSGKTFASVIYIIDYVRKTPGHLARMRLITPTFADAVASYVEGPSGLLTLDPTAKFQAGAPGGARVIWPNGAELLIIGIASPRDVDRLRASGGRSLDIFSEAAANAYLEDAWHQALLGRNLGSRPHAILDTTPRPMPMLRRLMAQDDTVVTRATTHDNPHLGDAYLKEVDREKGSRRYRQEVLGEILEDVEGALWSSEDIERSRVPYATAMARCTTLAIGVDPAVSPGGTTGVVVAGRDEAGHLYVLEDFSAPGTPGIWADAVARACEKYGDPMVVVETNQGGALLTQVLQQVRPGMAIKPVNAATSKAERAAPMAVKWEADDQVAHIAGKDFEATADLENQMLEFVPGGPSPDRLDAMVWALTYLHQRHVLPASIADPDDRMLPDALALPRGSWDEFDDHPFARDFHQPGAIFYEGGL